MDVVQNRGVPHVPDAGVVVWGLFWTLDRRRQGNGYEALAISHQEIEACARLYGLRLRPWEMGALDAMEQARRAWLRPSEDKSEPMTPELFRSLFGRSN